MIRLWRVVALAMLVSGCGYGLAGRSTSIPSNIKRIGVPMFQNLTPYPEMDLIFTEAVRAELQTHKSFVVVPDATGVDAVVNVTIQSMNRTLQAVTADTRQASSYTLQVVLAGEFKDLTAKTDLWKNPAMRLAEDYPVTNDLDLAAQFAQDRNAIERVVKKFAERIVSAMLTSF
jgi:outer membrane lipopolysaccharide assembly protein LptE/RlpB